MPIVHYPEVVFQEHLTHPFFKDMTGQRFNLLTVIGFAGRSNRYTQWYCQCDCGSFCVIWQGNLKNDGTISCGCQAAERRRTAPLKHGHARKGKLTTEFKIWCAMIERCHCPTVTAYKDYGGRGITVCDEWRNDFAAFYRDMGPRPSKQHSIDRIDNDKGYSPDNCRWATIFQQARNRRNNRFYTFNGETRCLPEWSEVLKIKITTLRMRLIKGWSIEEAFTTPVPIKA